MRDPASAPTNTNHSWIKQAAKRPLFLAAVLAIPLTLSLAATPAHAVTYRSYTKCLAQQPDSEFTTNIVNEVKQSTSSIKNETSRFSFLVSLAGAFAECGNYAEARETLENLKTLDMNGVHVYERQLSNGQYVSHDQSLYEEIAVISEQIGDDTYARYFFERLSAPVKVKALGRMAQIAARLGREDRTKFLLQAMDATWSAYSKAEVARQNTPPNTKLRDTMTRQVNEIIEGNAARATKAVTAPTKNPYANTSKEELEKIRQSLKREFDAIPKPPVELIDLNTAHEVAKKQVYAGSFTEVIDEIPSLISPDHKVDILFTAAYEAMRQSNDEALHAVIPVLLKASNDMPLLMEDKLADLTLDLISKKHIDEAKQTLGALQEIVDLLTGISYVEGLLEIKKAQTELADTQGLAKTESMLSTELKKVGARPGTGVDLSPHKVSTNNQHVKKDNDDFVRSLKDGIKNIITIVNRLIHINNDDALYAQAQKELERGRPEVAMKTADQIGTASIRSSILIQLMPVKYIAVIE